MMKTLFRYSLCAVMMFAAAAITSVVVAQEASKASAGKCSLEGIVYNEINEPVADAIITSPGHALKRTGDDGAFRLEGLAEWTTVRIQADGYYPKTLRVVGDQTSLPIFLIPLSDRDYNESLVDIDGVTQEGVAHRGLNENLAKKDFSLGSTTLERALQGKLTGLQVVQKSGMPGEGGYFNLRGVRSLTASNAPLIVINGVPYMADDNDSQIINGYSRSVFQTINPQDIANVTLLKGAEAAAYGSMGSNGVLLIETDGAKSDNLDTKISFVGSVGVNWQNQRLPLLDAAQYKSYMSDIAMSYYNNDMGAFFGEFPFMSSPTAANAQLYQFNTDWQDEIYHTSLTHDYLFRVEGGDAIAKYDISLGYTGDEGTLRGSRSDRYHAQINSNVLVSKLFEINASVNLSYLNTDAQEQGLSYETNPLLAAYRRSPLLSPYKSSTVPGADGYGLLPVYSSYRLGSSDDEHFFVSNPVALVNSVDATLRQYDVNARLQLVYKPLADLTFAATVGLFANHDREKIFIPGTDNEDITPRYDNHGTTINEVRVGEGEVFNMFYGVTGNYHHLYAGKHDLSVKAGFSVLTTTKEYDMASGRNSASDFYQEISNATVAEALYVKGYNNSWNWLDGYVTADYTYGNWARVGLVGALDGASSTGKDADRIHFYPGAHATLMVANLPKVREQSWLNSLDVFADYSTTGNSRYSSKLGKYYYSSRSFQMIAGIVRANVPNTELDVERNHTFNIGVDLMAYRNRLRVRAGYYQTKAEDVLMLGSRSSALGSSAYYTNDAALRNRGLELTAQAALIATRDWRWTIGATLTSLHNEVTSLGAADSYVTPVGDGAQLITEVGKEAYGFYGYETKGVFSTTADAVASGLKNRNGVAYQAGDVIYVDHNHDGIINDEDKVNLGTALPKVYGSFNTSVEYKGWALDLNFVFSKGNKAYNAMRRIAESSSDFGNQAKSVNRRWQNEGDITLMPRAVWGDVVGNNDFSDRFVEDASYLKLRDITLSYTFNKKVWNFFQGGTLYVTGQNLICLTDYLGLDPEYSYDYSVAMQGIDYGKVALPKSVKFGVNLKF